MTRIKTGWIPALILSLLSVGILVYAGAGYGFFVPLGFALCGWLAVWLTRRGKVRLGRLIWGLVGAGVICIASTLVWIGVHYVRSLNRELPADCDTIIVLGTTIWDGAPSPHLRMRLDAALEAAGYYPDAVIIPSGGLDRGENVTEAQAMATYLEERGIAGDRILIEPQATSTYENLIYSRPLARGDSTVIVTSGFHTLRTGLWCRWMDWDVVTLGAPTPWNVGVHWWVRECLALWKDIVKHFFVT